MPSSAPPSSDRSAGAVVQSAFSPVPLSGCLFIPLTFPVPSVSNVGTEVTAGQPLGWASDGEIAATAPVRGIVRGITQVTLMDGSAVDAVELQTISELDQIQQMGGGELVRNSVICVDPAKWINRFAAAGIDVRRIGSPNLLEQLRQGLEQPINTLICCLLDGDPNLPLNAVLVKSFPEEFIRGIELLATLSGASQIIVVHDPAAVSPRRLSGLQALLRNRGYRAVQADSGYPQSDPTLLLHTVLGRKLRPGRSPVEQGVLLLDGPAAMAVGRLRCHRQPMTTVPVAIRDHVAKVTHLLEITVGTPLLDVCRWLGIPPDGVTVRGGDFLRDLIPGPNAMIGPGELAIHISARSVTANPDPCIRCGWCAEACPTSVQPARLLEAAQRSELSLAEKFGLNACIECGICTFICPSRLPLLTAIRTLKPGRLSAVGPGKSYPAKAIGQ